MPNKTSETFTRRAPKSEPTTWNEKTRTFRATIAAGAGVTREHWDEGRYVERLDHSGVELASEVPFLNSHRTGQVADVIGKVEKVEKVGDLLEAVIRLSSRPEVQDIATDIRETILSGISVGYDVLAWSETTDEAGRRIKTATKWLLREVSLVAIPADDAARIRSKKTMPINADDHEDETAVSKPAKRATRAASEIEIRAFAQQSGLPNDWVDDQLDAGVTKSAMHRSAVDYMAARQKEQPDTQPIIGAGGTGSGLNNPTFRAEAMGEAIACRADQTFTPSEPARQFMHMTLPDLAREHLRHAGVDVRNMSQSNVIERAFAIRSSGMHTTSDFGLVLSSAVGRVLRASYEAVPSGLKTLARRLEFKDFRARTMIALSGLSGLEKVNEHGEYKRATLEESGETAKLHTFGKIFGISRQAIINDDLGAFSTLPRKFGVEFANFEAEQLAALLVANKVMSDGKALFHADHGNLATTGAAPGETTLSAGRMAMRLQKDTAGKMIGVGPRALVVGAELETGSEKLMAQITAASTDDVQPVRLSVVVEPRLEGKAWYLAADAALIDGLIYANLEGTNGPELIPREGFDIDGMELKARLDFGCAFVDWRSWYRNAGAA